MLSQALPKQDIHSITLVDTQSVITLKGMARQTFVYVIDHHKKKEDFNPSWNFQFVNRGACVTYFVEQIMEEGGNLSILHATLLLLGIYEDTGSLTYASTTAHDAQAVAFLLSQGASLKIANEYLNFSLSEEQQKVLDELIKNQRLIELKKQRILISHANAEFLEEEVSSIAHKLADLYDPDGLFIFVKTREGIRLIARSTSDRIDVANIAEKYGGGGHPRAAAALIQEQKKETHLLADYENDLIKDLDTFINPSITVKQIMSKNPLLLEPTLKAEEALQLMQRFGYEGFPVVENNQIIGLLTRRAVDRAITHKMNLPARSLMEAGNYAVYPEATLEELHQLMARVNWGQIPVVDKESGTIIGIVTRTDLLQAYSGAQSPFNGHINLATTLEENLNPLLLELVKVIAQVANEMKMHVYLVGGVVRDILLNAPLFDLDFVVEGNAIELTQQLSELYGGKTVSHRQFGTAKWFLENANIPFSVTQLKNYKLPKSVDLISARTEFYKNPIALPTVKLSSIKLDLQRRDFTINTMAIQLDGKHYGELLDYWGGLDDLKNGVIRVLHSLSFVDDPTRILRAIRFEQRFGFKIEDRTMELLLEARPLLKQVSGDRLRHEINLILQEQQLVEIFQHLDQLGLLQAIDPNFSFSKGTASLLKLSLQTKPADKWELPQNVGKVPLALLVHYCILFGNYAEEEISKICSRLKLPAILQKSILQTHSLIEHLPHLADQKASHIYALLKEIPNYVLYAAHFFFYEQEKVLQIIDQYLGEWSKIKLYTSGETLRERGVPPGPIYKEILQQLTDAWLDGKVTSQTEEEELLEHILKSQLAEEKNKRKGKSLPSIS